LWQRSSKVAPPCWPHVAGFWKPGESTTTSDETVWIGVDIDLQRNHRLNTLPFQTFHKFHTAIYPFLIIRSERATDVQYTQLYANTGARVAQSV
jgi:hypothetical protein